MRSQLDICIMSAFHKRPGSPFSWPPLRRSCRNRIGRRHPTHAVTAAATVSAIRGERLEVSVSFDPTRATSPSAASCPRASLRCRWVVYAAASRPRCCLMSPSFNCGSTLSLSASADAAQQRGSPRAAVAALALLGLLARLLSGFDSKARELGALNYVVQVVAHEHDELATVF